jgi:fucose 4-O-acetylase-like acetyltransferase
LNSRIKWIDELKGLAIFLVVYGHNFPFTEKYIYSFHMPLFFIIAGIFHPKKSAFTNVKKRFKGLIIPYLLWSTILFVFWFFIGRKYGASSELNLSVYKNFLGVFYAQGGRQYMDWGIPMWFLTTLFVCFLLFHLTQMIKNTEIKFIVLITLPIIGFSLPYLFEFKLLWSLDVAFVSILFYSIGYYLNSNLLKLEKLNSWVLILILGLIHIGTYNLNSKIDMYRSIYGNELFFITNGILGSFFYILLIKKTPTLPFLSVLGKLTIPILAMQIRAVTFIKLILMLSFGLTIFNFTEFQKITISIIQIILITPIALIINKYIPVLNGGYKKI